MVPSHTSTARSGESSRRSHPERHHDVGALVARREDPHFGAEEIGWRGKGRLALVARPDEASPKASPWLEPTPDGDDVRDAARVGASVQERVHGDREVARPAVLLGLDRVQQRVVLDRCNPSVVTRFQGDYEQFNGRLSRFAVSRVRKSIGRRGGSLGIPACNKPCKARTVRGQGAHRRRHWTAFEDAQGNEQCGRDAHRSLQRNGCRGPRRRARHEEGPQARPKAGQAAFEAARLRDRALPGDGRLGAGGHAALRTIVEDVPGSDRLPIRDRDNYGTRWTP